ncbi:ribonuclease H-like domain-containing protein [Tanacetum coccineum]
MRRSRSIDCYKTGLEFVEEKHKVYKANESIYLQDIKGLKFEIHLGEIAIRELKKKLEIVQKEKDGIQLNVDKFEHASKSLNKLIECQIVDNCKKGLGDENYNVVPPPYTGNFMPIIPDLSFTGLDEFVNEPVVENCKAMSSKEEPKGNPQIDLLDQGVIDTTKDNPSGVLKSFIIRIENLVDHKVKVIRCDNRTEFKNREMNQFCKMKGIVRQFSVARTPQQNRVAKKRNMTLIEAAKTMLADSKLPTTFWAEEINTACYVQNIVLVVKPHNKTPYELFHVRTPNLSFMRPFGCPVTILNTIDHLGKFDGKADEGFFVGYSLNSKAFRVFNNRTRIVEENLHIRFGESTPNVAGSGPDWLFDIDALTRIMNYEPIVSGTQSNGFADPKSSYDDGSKPSSDDGKKVDEDPRKDSEYKDQEKEDNVNSTNNVNAAKDINIFDFSRGNEDDDAETDMNNLDTTIQVSPNPTTRIHKDHPLDKVIGDLQSATQTRRMSKNLKEYKFALNRSLGYTQEEGIDYDEVFAPVARIEAIRLFLAYASFKYFVVYQMDVKSAFLYGKIEEGFKTARHHGVLKSPFAQDEDGKEVDVYMYRSMIGSLMYLTSSRPDIMFLVCACARYQVNPKVSHLHAIERIFSDYVETCLDRKSDNKRGCQILRSRLIFMAVQEHIKWLAIPQQKLAFGEAAITASSLEAEQDNARVESTGDEESLGEDASKQGRINAVDADEFITLVNDQDDADMFDVNTLTGDELLWISNLAALKSVNTKVKDNVVVRASVPVSCCQSKVMQKFKKKGIMVEPLKKKDQISFDKQEAIRLQAEFVEEERLAREKDEANVALTEEWDDIQAKVDADYQLAQRLQAEEQE